MTKNELKVGEYICSKDSAFKIAEIGYDGNMVWANNFLNLDYDYSESKKEYKVVLRTYTYNISWQYYKEYRIISKQEAYQKVIIFIFKRLVNGNL